MTSAQPDVAASRYRFAGGDGTVWLGLRAAPLTAIAVALFATVGGLYVGVPLPLAVLVLVAGVALALVPVAGQAGVEWLSPLARRWAAIASRKASVVDRAVKRVPVQRYPTRVLRLPTEYGRLRLLDAEIGAVGVVDDPAARAYTVVLAVAGADRFALLDSGEQAARLAGWGTALSALAADPEIRRVQWVERAGPDLRDPGAWLRERSGATEDDAGAVEDYSAMAAHLKAGARRHEVWLAVQLSRRVGETRTGGRAVVADRVREIAAALLAADLVARPLPVADVGWLLRRFADHHADEREHRDVRWTGRAVVAPN